MLSKLNPILLAVMLLPVSGCASSIRVLAPAEGCSTLIADRWRQPVASAVLGDSGDAALDWQMFGLAQTGQLTVANADKAAIIETVERCEARDRAAVQRVQAPWWRRLGG